MSLYPGTGTIVGMRITDDTPTLFDPTTNRIIDFVAITETPEQALARLADYGAHLVVLPCAEAHQRYRQSFVSEPEEITADRFHEMLNILPPLQWHRDGNGESFKMMEMTAADITAIFVQLNGRYFSFSDSVTLRHADCCARVFHSPAYRMARDGIDTATLDRSDPESGRA